MPIRWSACTDVGLKRETNEDSYKANPSEALFVVADGMGGHAAGEIASRIAVDTVNEFIELTSRDKDITWPFEFDENITMEGNRLKTAIRLANRKVIGAIQKREDLRGMGTTIVSLWVNGKRAYVGHVGDSRAYLVRENQMSQLTNDHSWVNEQQRKGTLSREQARTHPFRNVVTRALGGKEKVEVDLLEIELKPQDLFLLCSDGLSSLVDDKTILETLLASRTDLDAATKNLVAQANGHGGDDNSTVILVEYVE